MNAFFETTDGFNFQIIDPLIESRGVRLTWFDRNFFKTFIFFNKMDNSFPKCKFLLFECFKILWHLRVIQNKKNNSVL